MLTGKQRSYLRSLASNMDAVFRIGKNGIDDEMIKQLDDVLEARELIKIKVLNNIDMSAKEACEIVCDKLNCEGIQSIGKKFVVYRKSTKRPKIELPN